MDWGELITLVVAVLVSIGVGVGAALVPMFVNAEVYIVALAANVDSRSMLAFLIVVHVMATTVGKAFVFQLARVGTRRLKVVEPKAPRSAFGRGWQRMTHWYSGTRLAAKIRELSNRLIALLEHRYGGGLTVFLSSLLGLPPLAIVTILAGASKQPRWLFLTMVFIGRLLQFLALAFILHGLPWFEDFRHWLSGLW